MPNIPAHSFLTEDPLYTDIYSVIKRKKVSHYNFLFNFEDNKDNCSLKSSEGVFNLIAKGMCPLPINYCDLNKIFHIVEFLGKIKQPIIVLDIGCAKSEVLIASYRHRVQNMEYHGIDLNIKDLRNTLMTTKTKDPYYLYKLSANNRLPFKDEFFNVILMLDVIEHMPSLDEGYELFNRAWKLLKPGGHLLLMTPNKDNADRELVCKFAHDHEYTLDELKYFFTYFDDLTIENMTGYWMSKSRYKQLIQSNTPYMESIFNQLVMSEQAKLSAMGNFYPQYAKQVYFTLKKGEKNAT